MSAIPGVTELTDDYRVGRPEMRLRIDRGAAKRVGASTQQDVASTVRTATAGTKASTLRHGDDEYDIVVELAPEYRDDLQAVLAMRIPGKEDTSPDTFPVPLSTVASYELAGGSGSIRHVDQKLVVTIEGDVEEGFNENAVRDAVKASHRVEGPVSRRRGSTLRLGGADDEQQRAQEFLSQAFAIAILLIALVLVTQFNRFDLPLVILASVVLSLIGVLWGLLLTGTPFGIMMTGLGVISLAGVVVNNAIVLLDYVEQLRARGTTMHDALVQAGTRALPARDAHRHDHHPGPGAHGHRPVGGLLPGQAHPGEPVGPMVGAHGRGGHLRPRGGHGADPRDGADHVRRVGRRPFARAARPRPAQARSGRSPGHAARGGGAAQVPGGDGGRGGGRGRRRRRGRCSPGPAPPGGAGCRRGGRPGAGGTVGSAAC
jgi:hypothetical protein